MLRSYTGALIVTAVLCAAVPPSPAHAAGQRSFVRSDGVDVGNTQCSLSNPCRSFDVAIGVTNSGGEVVMLDTAGYGTMTITKAITVIGPTGLYGGISVGAGASGVTINAGNGDTVKLRGLDIAGLSGATNGINIINAAGVHIEKTSVSNFGADNAQCINVASAASTIRVFIVDSFLRQCRIAVNATGSQQLANVSSIAIDNSHLERGVNSGVSTTTYGVFVQGNMDVLIRNSSLSRYTSAVRFVDPLAGGASHVTINGSELTRSNAGVQYANSVTNGVGQITILNSQLTTLTEGINISNTAVGGNTQLNIADSQIAYTGSNALTVANSAADANTRVFAEISRSQVQSTNGNAIELSATNGSKTYLVLQDSHLAHATAVLKTSGTASDVSASLVRTTVNNCTTAVDHGQGVVRLDAVHIVRCSDDFVNNGSGNIVSFNNNLIHDVPNSSPVTHISSFTIVTPR
jgi:hypothetical protein